MSASEPICRRMLRIVVILVLAVMGSFTWAGSARAANCVVAGSQGSTGPLNWQTYCWLDLSSYNNAIARTSAGQNFSYTLPDGTTMTFNMRVANSGPGLTAAASPSWTGAAVGNTAFLGITGRPILYQTGGGTSTVTIRNIVLTPPPGSGAITAYMFVAADAESTNDGESLSFQTNGSAWQMLDQVGPTSGNAYPTITGVGTNTFTETGVAGTVGAYIVGSTTPTQIVTTMVGSGLQGAMFAVRFASIRLNMQIQGARVAAADQFKFDITSTSGGSLLASGTSSGTGLGPFTAASLTTASALPITLSQMMASGSANTIDHYRSLLTCTNSANSSTPLPIAVATTSYDFGALQFGDNVLCTYSNMPYPHLRLSKAMGAGGRRFASDQFVLNILDGTTVVATTTTSGSGSTVNNGSTPQLQGVAGTTYILSELGEGSTALEQYTSAMVCTNAWGGSNSSLPNTLGGSVTPQMGDVISCTITNTRRGNNATLDVTKTSQLVSDPINGSGNPFAIPGAIVRYTFVVSNTGNTTVDNNSLVLIDVVPSQIEVGTASNPIFAQGSPTSALTFNPATGIRYSNSAAPPTSFAACTYSPSGAYDPAVRYICLNPQGTMSARTSGNPAPNFSLSLDARVR